MSIELRGSKAYQVFVEELNKGLDQCDSTLRSESPLDRQEIERLECEFHRVKGGAGFFGLQSISKLAGAAEELLKNVQELSGADKQALQEWVAELRRENGTLETGEE
ncbi:MAG: Hpt domain-containing protein [Bdellovibrionales bacterium]|nr:Hpt domain-containing protein [Bdellovibrionales bacterium]